MSIEIKQLTINSSIEKEMQDDTDKKEPPASASSGSCLDTEAVKRDVLDACKQMIRQALSEGQVR